MAYDLFVSYSRRDNERGRVTELVDQVQADYQQFAGRPLVPFFDLREIGGMEDWRHRILLGLRESRLLLACLSPAYLASEYCQWEFNEYLKHEAGRFARGEGVAPIYFVEVPEWTNKNFEQQCAAWVSELRRRQHFDLRAWFFAGVEALRDHTVSTQMRRLNAQLRDRLTLEERAARSVGNVDAHNPHFVGRVAELRRLREAVALGRVGVLTAVHGLGGVGKTALAVEYAHAFAHEYGGGRWQIRCEGSTSLAVSMSTLSSPLGLTFSDDESRTPDRQCDRVLRELRERTAASDSKRCLLILDNIDQPELLEPAQVQRLPAAEWLHVVATTRLAEQQLSGTSHDRVFLPVDHLPEAHALELIEAYQPGGFSDNIEREAAREIVKLLGGFTLAVESTAAYLSQFAGIVTCAGFLTRLRTEGLGSLDASADEASVRIRHGEKRLKATIQPTWERLGEREQLALTYAALLPSDQVELDWIRALVSRAYPDVGVDAEPGYPDSWRTLIRLVSGLRLLQRGKMHRVVQSVIRQLNSHDVLEERKASLQSFFENLKQSIEGQLAQFDPSRGTFKMRFSADQENLKERKLEPILRAMSGRSRWHPKEAVYVTTMGPQEDYCDVYRFPCCGLHVVLGEQQPSQFRADGCEDVGE